MTPLVTFAAGLVLGGTGIWLALFVAPNRGDAWGYLGLVLIGIGFVTAISAVFFLPR